MILLVALINNDIMSLHCPQHSSPWVWHIIILNLREIKTFVLHVGVNDCVVERAFWTLHCQVIAMNMKDCRDAMQSIQTQLHKWESKDNYVYILIKKPPHPTYKDHDQPMSLYCFDCNRLTCREWLHEGKLIDDWAGTTTASTCRHP